MESNVIVKCEIRKTISDPNVNGVFVWFDENGDWKLLFTYYPNELTFDSDEFIGLTEKQALDLHWEKDLEYFRAIEEELKEEEEFNEYNE